MKCTLYATTIAIVAMSPAAVPAALAHPMGGHGPAMPHQPINGTVVNPGTIHGTLVNPGTIHGTVVNPGTIHGTSVNPGPVNGTIVQPQS